jgi:hypothetical protein
MLTTIDADVSQNDSHDTDKFRVRIWDDVGLRYDNHIGKSDDPANHTTEIGGGSIKIQRKLVSNFFLVNFESGFLFNGCSDLWQSMQA